MYTIEICIEIITEKIRHYFPEQGYQFLFDFLDNGL